MNLLRVILASLALLLPVPAVMAVDGELETLQGLVAGGRLDEALVGLDAYLETRPEDAQARFMKGLVLVKLGRNAAAIEVFNTLARDYPELPEPFNNLAVLYAAEGRYEEARDALLVAINTHPSYATAHENLGDIYARMAAVAYDQALALDQQNRAAQAKLNLVNDLFSLPAGQPQAPRAALAASSAAAPAEPPSRGQSSQGAAQVETEVTLVIRDWARAWSAQDVPAYLSHYGDGFRPPGGVSRAVWSKQRQRRLTKPARIDVMLGETRVEPRGAGRARATFVQVYRSDIYRDRTRKALDLAREDGAWKIVAEGTLP